MSVRRNDYRGPVSGPGWTSLAQVALDLCPADDPRRADVVELAAQTARADGDHTAALGYARTWADLAAGTPAECAAQLLLADLSWQAGHLGDMWKYLDAAARATATVDDKWRHTAARTQALMRLERHEECVKLATATLAEQPRPESVLVSLLTDRATSLGALGRTDAALADYDDAAARAERLGDRLAIGRIANNRLQALRLRCMPRPAAEAVIAETLALLRRHRLHEYLGKINRNAIDLAVFHGDLAAAYAHARERLPDEPNPVERTIAASKAAYLAAESGAESAARDLLALARTAGATLEAPWMRTYPAWAQVRIAAAFDRPHEVRAALMAYAATTDVPGHRTRASRAAHTALVAMGPQAGTSASGLTTSEIRAFVKRCLASPLDAVEAEESTSALLGAALKERDGDHADAWAAATRALTGAEDQDADQRAWLHVIAGRTALHIGRDAEATGHAVAARRLLAAWAGPLVVAAERLAARCGTTRLTSRERNVLELIAAGRSNRQIAAALGIAERTVAVHVSRILTKTGSASRTEAARWHRDESG